MNKSVKSKAPKRAPKQQQSNSKSSLRQQLKGELTRRNERGFLRKANRKVQASAAAAYATGQSTGAPMIRASRDSSRIIHRELVGSINGSTNFAIAQALALNPGIAATFPWLSTQALAWDQYRFNKLKFEFFTRTGSNTQGSMMLVPDYDAADAPPVSEIVASAYEDVQEDAPWKDICLDLRQNAMHSMGPKKFVRTGPLASNLDIKTYDVGNMFAITTDGGATPGGWGKLWVEYDVELSVPQLPPTGYPLPAAQHFPSASNAPDSTNILGAAPVSSGADLVSVSASIVTFKQPGRFLVTYNTVSTTNTVNADPTPGGAGTLVLTYGTGATGHFNAGSGTLFTNCSAVVDVGIGDTLIFDNTVVGGTEAEMIVIQLPSSLN